MKLLFLTEFFPKNNQLVFSGGVEARTYYIANQAKQDFSVTVISSPFKSAPATPLSIFPRILYLIISFIKVLLTDFDLIEASNVVTYLPAYLAAKLKRKPVIAWIPDLIGNHWRDFGFIVGGLGWILEKISLKLSWTKIIALSQTTADKLIACGINPAKITVIHAGIDPEEFK